MPSPTLYSRDELEAQRRAQVETEKAARRQQMIQTWMMLQNMNRPQPYQLPMPVPMPVNPNANRLQTNCTTNRIGDTSYTDCH